ncbi:hypothetical protein AB0D04_33735 [Streptomyces sp. NPDC048483]|uniref:hypothetical protein n=1 Tax=Streptomyces sp. NPDC048483 TaxID=3154927 RepID=UPI003444D105
MHQTAVKTAFGLTDPSVIPALIARLRTDVLSLLRDGDELPDRLLEAVLASGDRELCTAFASNSHRDACDPAFRLRLAGLGRPENGWALWQHWDVRAAVLAAADPADPGWYAPGGLVETLLKSEVKGILTPALEGPFPELVARALAQSARQLPLPVVLDACGVLLACGGGAESLVGLAGAVENAAHPGLPELLREAAVAPDPASFLRDRRVPGEWEDPEAVAQLRGIRTGIRRSGAPLNWDLMRKEHERWPFTPNVLITLSQWPDCPEDLAMAGFRAYPRTSAAHAARLPMDVLLGRPARAGRFDIAALLRRGIPEGWLPVERILAEAAPARSFLAALPYDHEPTRRAVVELLAPLGSDPASWLTLYARLPTFEGSATALVAEACSSTERHTRWPQPLDADFPAKEPDGARAVFQQLYSCAPEEVQLSLVPHLDMRAVQHLLVSGSPSKRLYGEVVAVHGTAALEAHASDWSLPVEEREALLDVDEPGVNARLYAYCRNITPAERVRILASRGRHGGEELIAPRSDLDLGHYRDWVAAGLGSGDLEVARVIVHQIKLRTEAGRLRVAIALWEQQGPDAVRRLMDPVGGEEYHPWPEPTQRAVHQALDGPDGLDVLRRRLAAEENPERVIASLRQQTRVYGAGVHWIVSEGGTLPWAELRRAHAADPFPDEPLWVLTREPDCPHAMLLEALREGPLVRQGHTADSVVRALDRGTLTPDDVLRHARPAQQAFDFLTGTGSWRRITAPAWAQPCTLAAELTAAHLGADVEAWAIALHMMPEFHGTIPELLATSGAVAS